MATLEEDELELNHETKAKQVHTTTKHDINITIYFNVAIHECANTLKSLLLYYPYFPYKILISTEIKVGAKKKI